MKQVVVMSGGNTFNSDEEYLESLKTKAVSLEYFKPRADWKVSLQTELGESYQVLQPRMPNVSNAKYDEWKIWFERLTPLLNDGVIFIGHSLGGIFLSKYLSENKLDIKVSAAILIAPPHGDIVGGEALATFNLTNNLELFNRQVGRIVMFFSRDDVVVPIDHMEKYRRDLPDAEYNVFEDRGHFSQIEFPELISEIKGLD